MYDQMTLPGFGSAISSPGPESGPMPCAAPAGRMIAPSGPAPAHANLSARQAKEMGLLTSGTFGPPSTGSSPSAALSTSLASRLQVVTAMLGSTLYKLTWKPWVTPSGVSRLRLRASVRRTHATALSGWPTPTARDWKDGAECLNVQINSLLGRTAWLTGWATPCAMEPDQSAETVIARKARLSASTGIFRGPALPLGTQAQLAGWPTPVVSDSAKAENAALRPGAMVLGNAALLSGWPTPCAQDGPNGGPSQGTDRLPGAAAQVMEIRGRLTASGMAPIGSTAEIPRVHDGGPLTAAHSLWLQGIPAVWERCALAAMQSMPKSRRGSSKR